MREAPELYAQILRTYVAWARTLLPLALFVFVPLGLVHAIPIHAEVTTIDFDGVVEILGAFGTLMLLATTGLIGEVFYAGAVSIALTHPHDGEPPRLREVAGMIDYRTLIAVDLAFGALVALGLVALVAPGILVFVYLGLAAPVAEIERCGFRAAFARSLQIVRRHFWLVFWVLVPIELASDAITGAATAICHGLFGDSLIAAWATDTTSNVVLTPFYAVAAVLLTLRLIADRDGQAPPLHSEPVPG